MYRRDPKAENKEIVKLYQTMMRSWQPKKPDDRSLVRKAFKMALEAHKDMRRKTGEPYIYHPLSVAIIAAKEIGLGTTSIICALLHDVVEDTEYTIEDIRGLFGDKVASIIDGLTKIKGIFDQHTASIHAENFKKILLTLSDDVRVILIKLADRLHNMRTLYALTHEKQLKISSETVYLYAPLAHRLGLHAIKSELEDLALKYHEPEIFESISRKLEETSEERKRFIRNFTLPLKELLTEKGFDFDIAGRPKSIAAIWQKMQKKEVPFEEIYDLFAIRIVINSPIETEKDDCWKVYSAVTSVYRPNMERLRDWISFPKANGYEALHTTVMSNTGKWVEIQIRSKRMDDIAEKGYAAHWKYKEVMNVNSQIDNWLDRIREMITSPQEDALSFLDDVKGYFFLDEISVFTPQGELRTLPAKSTVLDFAYAIHSQVGNTCIGAKVDKKLVSLYHELKNGQQIEIITSAKQKPKEEWLNNVVTTRARTNIKNALREDKKLYSARGKHKLAEWFNEEGLKFTTGNIEKFELACSFNNPIDLFYAVATDQISREHFTVFAHGNYPEGWITYLDSSEPNAGHHHPPASREQPNDDLRLRETVTGSLIATCCNPIPGDEVIGLQESESEPLVIHRTNCARAQELMSVSGSTMVRVNWHAHGAISFLTEVKIAGIDKQGLINEITRVISNELNLNIKAFHIDAHHGLTEGSISIFVENTSRINDLIEELKKIEGLNNVSRIS